MKKIAICSIVAAVIAIPALALAPESGLKVGEMVTPFHPQHIAGPDKGTDTCPPCKYGNRPAVQIWVNGDATDNVALIANNLSSRVNGSKTELKGFVINLTRCDACVKATDQIASMTKTQNIGIAHLSVEDEAIKNYRVSTEAGVKNTVFVYKNRKVAAKFVNLKGDAAGLKALNAAVDSIEK